MKPEDTPRRIRFGPYEADFHTQELRKHGIRLRVCGQPLQVLEVLAARPGELVTRAELQQRLWPEQVFVDASHGLNAAVNKLREALSDSASEPKYIETLPRRGYRFVGCVEEETSQPVVIAEVAAPSGEQISVESAAKIEPCGEMPAAERSRRRAGRSMILPIAAALLCVVGLSIFARKLYDREDLESQTRKVEVERLASVGPGVPQGSFFQAAKLRTAVGGRVPANERNAVAGDSVIDDQEPVALDAGASVQHALTIRRVIWGDGGNAAPQFSPDGKRIAFMSNRDGPWQIWVSDVDGSRARQVSFTESAGTPRWSPDGTSIAFDAPFEGGTWIFVVRVDQTERAKPIVEGLVPSFSRDGKWIYFASERTGEWQVWKTSRRDGSERQVTFQGGFAALESTDGYIYYSKSRYPQPEICRVRIQGGSEVCGFEHLRPRTWASWAPTREGIVFAEDLPGGKAALSLYDPARRQERDLALLESAPFWVGASIDGKRAIMNDAAERQISMVDHLR